MSPIEELAARGRPVTRILFVMAAFGASALTPARQTEPEKVTITRFLERVKAYVAQRDKLEASLPSLPKQTTPEQIDQHQRALEALVRSSRSNARIGDLFGADMTAYLRKRLQQVFAGPDGPTMRAQILEEYPGPTPLTVNGRYPESVPLSNIPHPVFAVLPELPDAVEFRFVGPQLVVLDSRARLIVDFIRNALPPK